MAAALLAFAAICALHSEAYAQDGSVRQSYEDGPMIVRQLSHADGRVTFHISFTGKGQPLAAGPPPPPPGTWQSLASGKCIDLPRGQAGDGTAAIQFDCHGGVNQQWKLSYAGETVRIISQMSGKCIGADQRKTNAQILQSACGDTSNQLWVLKQVADGYVVQNAASSLCLDVPRGSTANGTKLILWTCNCGSNQAWRYAPPEMP